MTYTCPRCSAPVTPSAQSCHACGYPGAPPAGPGPMARDAFAPLPAPAPPASTFPPSPPPPPFQSSVFDGYGSTSAPPPPPPPTSSWPEPPSAFSGAGGYPPPPPSANAWPGLPAMPAGPPPYGAPGIGAWDAPPPPAVMPPKANAGKGPIAFAAVAVVAAIAVVGWAVAGGIAPSPRPVAVVSHPAAWDARVQFAVDFVEGEKGRPFVHPVDITFVPEAEFEQDVTSSGDTTDEERAAADRQAGMMRALGMVSGQVDLESQQKTLAGSSILAYYSHKTEKVRVRGTELTPLVKATLVHEMTHAWQDQHHDLSRVEDMTGSEAQLAFRSVIEGDAVRVARSWSRSLPVVEQQDNSDDETKAVDTADERSKDVASILSTTMGAPYLLGPSFLAGLEADGGATRLNQAYTSPPPSSGVLLRPWTFGAATSTRRVEPPPLPEGRTAVDEDSLGALKIYLLLADRIDPHTALAASDAWVGDRFRLGTTDGGRVCLAGRIAAKGTAGAEAIASAFEQWDGAFAGGAVSVQRDGSDVTYQACDPGESAPITVPDRAGSTVIFPVARMEAWASARDQGATPAQAECAATSFVGHTTTAEAVDAETITPGRAAELWTAARGDCLR